MPPLDVLVDEYILTFLSTSTLLPRSKKRRNRDFTWAGEPLDSLVSTWWRRSRSPAGASWSFQSRLKAADFSGDLSSDQMVRASGREIYRQKSLNCGLVFLRGLADQ